MAELAEHPTVKRVRADAPAAPPPILDAGWLRRLALDGGADDVGFVALDAPALGAQRAEILAAFPRTRSLVSLVCRMNREPIRSPARSLANLEFHHVVDAVNDAARRIVAALEQAGVPALNVTAGFPMEADRWGSKMWVVSHKPIAEAAGLGRMGIHRNVIHPRFGNFILLGTVLVAAEVSEAGAPLDYNPCLECKLCVAACPTGAIAADGRFDFAACYTHNYREFMSGFTDWVETVADSGSRRAYRRQVTPAETVSMWQSLSFGANYKAAYCLSVCPAGEEVIGPYLADRRRFIDETVKPLREKAETIYVVAESDAEAYVARHLPTKRTKRVRNGLGGQGGVRGFLRGLPLVFQRGRSEGLAAVYHFTFTGREPLTATIEIRDRRLTVAEGHHGKADLRLVADSDTWLRFLRREASLPWALLRRKVRIKGSPKLLRAFGRCFPS